MKRSKFLLFLLLFCSPVAMAQEQDKLLQLLKSELTYSMNELKKQAQAPYYMNLRAMDDYTVNVTSSFGDSILPGNPDENTGSTSAVGQPGTG